MRLIPKAERKPCHCMKIALSLMLAALIVLSPLISIIVCRHLNEIQQVVKDIQSL